MVNDIDKTDVNDQSGYCPHKLQWELRKNQFRQFESIALGEHSWASHRQIEPLIRELEHIFCAGGWLAAVILSQAIVEISIGFYDIKKAAVDGFLKQFGLDDKAKWLKERRNELVHCKGNQAESVLLEEILSYREKLRQDAKRAVAYSLRIAFLPSKHPEVFNKYLQVKYGNSKET